MTSPPRPNRGLSLGSARTSSGNAPLNLGSGRGRASNRASRGRATHPSQSSTATSLIQDQATRSTDSDAHISRLSAINAGYLPKDPFSNLFSVQNRPQPQSEPTSSSNHQNPSIISHQNHKRPPLINIGTYLRSTALDDLVISFLSNGEGRKQIVSLGAGSDSRFWRLNASELSSTLNHYLELDFPQLTASKINSIIKTDLLRNSLFKDGDVDEQSQIRIENDNSSLISPKYSLIPCDLRSFHSTSQPSTSSSSSIPSNSTSTLTPSTSTNPSSTLPSSLLSSLDPNLPTLILCECVLAYLPPKEGDSVLEYFSNHFEKCKMVCYDMCIAGDGNEDSNSGNGGGSRNGNGGGSLRNLMDDDDDEEKGMGQVSRFGKVMLQNLESRNLYLPGARYYSTTSSNSKRFEKVLKGKERDNKSQANQSQIQSDLFISGFKSLERIWTELDGAERERLSKIEHLDEVEELEMLLKHYAISWSERSKS